MRAIWKGAVAFGLVNVPVKLYSATEDHDVSLHQVHDKDGGRIRYQRRCEVCGKTSTTSTSTRRTTTASTRWCSPTRTSKSLPAEKSREIEVVEFVPSDQIDPIMFDRSYYLEPDSKSSKAYVLLRKTLEETDRTAIVQFALRQKTRLAALRVRGKVLMLQSLLWEDEVREADFPSLEETVGSPPRRRKCPRRWWIQFPARLHARRLHRRVPGAAPHPDRGEARAGRSAGHGEDLRRGAKRKKAARSWT